MKTEPTLPFTCHRPVEFSETDAAGIVHFSNYFRYMEFAEAAFFKQLGWPLLEQRKDGDYGFPRISCNARFKAPLYFGQEIIIHLNISNLEPSRIHYVFNFERQEQGKNVCLGGGEMSVVYAMRSADENRLIPVELPQSWRESLNERISR